MELKGHAGIVQVHVTLRKKTALLLLQEGATLPMNCPEMVRGKSLASLDKDRQSKVAVVGGAGDEEKGCARGGLSALETRRSVISPSCEWISVSGRLPASSPGAKAAVLQKQKH